MAKYKKRIESIGEALNAHNIDEAMEHFHHNCKLTWNGQFITDSRDEIKKYYEAVFGDPNSSIRIVKYLTTNGDDRVRILTETHDKKQYDDTYVFSNDEKIIEAIAVALENN